MGLLMAVCALAATLWLAFLYHQRTGPILTRIAIFAGFLVVLVFVGPWLPPLQTGVPLRDNLPTLFPLLGYWFVALYPFLAGDPRENPEEQPPL